MDGDEVAGDKVEGDKVTESDGGAGADTSGAPLQENADLGEADEASEGEGDGSDE